MDVYQVKTGHSRSFRRRAKLRLMQALAEHYITEEEYWALEESSETKHEYYDGQIFAMAGGSPEHAVLAAKVLVALGSQLRGKRCRVAGSDQHLKNEVTGLSTYPDAVVYCPPFRFDPRHQNTLLNPLVLVEVLSDLTYNYDLGKKFDNYKQIESLRDYILVSQDQIRIEHFHRNENNEWIHRAQSTLDGIVTLESIGCTLPLGEIYEGLDIPEDLPLPSPGDD